MLQPETFSLANVFVFITFFFICNQCKRARNVPFNEIINIVNLNVVNTVLL